MYLNKCLLKVTDNNAINVYVYMYIVCIYVHMYSIYIYVLMDISCIPIYSSYQINNICLFTSMLIYMLFTIPYLYNTCIHSFAFPTNVISFIVYIHYMYESKCFQWMNLYIMCTRIYTYSYIYIYLFQNVKYF